MKIIKNGFKNARLGIELDVYIIDGKEWFKAQDISEFFGYAKTTNMTRNIDFIEENSYTHIMRTEQGNSYPAQFINEFALYEVICKIRKVDVQRYTKAREFQKWVFEEVLPSLRKNNFYVDGENINENQITELKEEIGKLSQQVNNFSNILVNNKKKRQRLDTYLRQMFPNVENVYEQFLTKMKSSGMLDKNNRPTEMFMRYNADNNMFCHIVKTTDVVEDYLTLTNVGMENICKRAYIKDGKIHLKKL